MQPCFDPISRRPHDQEVLIAVKAAAPWAFALVFVVTTLPGCTDLALDSATSLNATPRDLLDPRAPDEARKDQAVPKKSAEPADSPKSGKRSRRSDSKETPVRPKPSTTALLGPPTRSAPLALTTFKDERTSSKEAILLEAIKVAELSKTIAANKKARLTLVDVWSTTCGPCMLNMPHVVAAEKKYGSRGLAVLTLSTDDPEDPQAVARAKDFLLKQKAFRVKNYLDATFLDAFEHFDFTTMPAVLLYDRDGKLLKKYTWDDPDHQFTYDEVDRSVAAYLDGMPMPKDSGSLPSPK